MSRAITRRHQTQCGSKRRFASMTEAEQERGRHGYVLYLYHCPWCAGVHLTRQPQRQDASQQREAG